MQEIQESKSVKVDNRNYTYENINVNVTYLNEPSKRAIESFNKGINKIIHKFI